MNKKIMQYLATLDLPDPIRGRIDTVTKAFQFLCGEEADDLFLSSEMTADGLQYLSLWGFQGPYWMEARNFVTEDDVDISTYVGSIKYLGLQYKNLNLPPDGPPTEDSRMRVEIETEKVRYSLLSATGSNCEHLTEIVSTLLLPNLKPKE